MMNFGSEYKIKILNSIQIIKDTFAAIEKFLPTYDQEFFQLEYLISTLLSDSSFDITRVSSQ